MKSFLGAHASCKGHQPFIIMLLSWLCGRPILVPFLVLTFWLNSLEQVEELIEVNRRLEALFVHIGLLIYTSIYHSHAFIAISFSNFTKLGLFFLVLKMSAVFFTTYLRNSALNCSHKHTSNLFSSYLTPVLATGCLMSFGSFFKTLKPSYFNSIIFMISAISVYKISLVTFEYRAI